MATSSWTPLHNSGTVAIQETAPTARRGVARRRQAQPLRLCGRIPSTEACLQLAGGSLRGAGAPGKQLPVGGGTSTLVGYRSVRVTAQAWRPKDDKNVEGRAKTLLRKLEKTSGLREEVVAALDSWAAFQQDFPLLALKRALRHLQTKQKWKLTLQLCKWMLEKGQGRTFGTYSAMLSSLAALQRDEEMDALWDLILCESLDSIPRYMWAQALDLYDARDRPLKVLEVFGSMHALDIRLNEESLQIVCRSLESLGAPGRAKALREEYSSVKTEIRYVGGVQTRVNTYRPVAGMNNPRKK